jgi:hypothetical protein
MSPATGRAYVIEFQSGDHGLSDETTPARGASWGRIHRMTLGKAIRQYITK